MLMASFCTVTIFRKDPPQKSAWAEVITPRPNRARFKISRKITPRLVWDVLANTSAAFLHAYYSSKLRQMKVSKSSSTICARRISFHVLTAPGIGMRPACP